MIMTRHGKLVYDNSTNCDICNEEPGEDRVRDHCLIIVGAAHEFYNI